jgi:hypothetical protein
VGLISGSRESLVPDIVRPYPCGGSRPVAAEVDSSILADHSCFLVTAVNYGEPPHNMAHLVQISRWRGSCACAAARICPNHSNTTAMSIENPPLCGTSEAKYFMKFLQLCVCQMTIHRRRSLRGRRWAYRLIGDDGLSLCSRGHLYGRSSRRAGPAKPTACFPEHLFLAAKRWQFVPASGVRWSRVSAAKG